MNKHEKGLNWQQIKEQNLLSALNIIRDKGPISRIEIGRLAGFSPTTCTGVTKHLLDCGMILETGIGDSSGGRRPILLEINNSRGAVIGIELDSDGVRSSLYNLRLDKKHGYSRRLEIGSSNMAQAVGECVDCLLMGSGTALENVFGMTVGVAGIVDSKRHDIVASTRFKSKETIDLHQGLTKRYGVPVYVENYGNLMALAEKELKYPEAGSLVYIVVNSGIGSGIILENRIFAGAFGGAGEIGHIPVDRAGPDCFCGNKGCLEVMGSIPVMIRKAVDGIVGGRRTRIKDLTGGDLNKVSLELIVQAFEQEDPFAKRILDEEIEVLYQGVLSAIHAYDPEVLILGGEICRFGDYLIRQIKEKLKETIFGYSLETRILRCSSLGEDVRVLGAGMFALKEFFRNPRVIFAEGECSS